MMLFFKPGKSEWNGCLRSFRLLLPVVFAIHLAGGFQFLEITGYGHKKLILIVHDVEIGHLRMVQNVCLHSITNGCLPFQQIAIFFIRLCINVKVDQGIFMYRNHIVKSEQAISAAIKLQNVFSGFDMCMVWFRGFHGDKIMEPGKDENNAYIRPPTSFVVLDFGISALQKSNIMIADLIDTKFLHAVPLSIS